MVDWIGYGLWQKTRQNDDVINHKGLVYGEIEIDLLRPIWPGTVYDENKIRQRCWLIVQVCSTLKTILNCHDQSNQE